MAALLHDIGKVIQRGSSERRTHQEYSMQATDELLKDITDDLNLNLNAIKELVLYHHESHNDNHTKYVKAKHIKILRYADRISAMERLEDEEKAIHLPLISVFSELNLNNTDKTKTAIFKLEEIPSEFVDNSGNFTLLPTVIDKNEYERSEKLASPDLYQNVYSKFIKEWKFFVDNKAFKSKRQLFEVLLTLMRKYFFFVPSAVYRAIPDISLYAHSATTAAIATCLWYFAEEEGGDTLPEEILTEKKPFIIISGDMSGIQNFIYQISSGNALKANKGRSLFLEFLVDAIISYILNELSLTEANKLYVTGGTFVLLAPNTSKIKNKIEEIKKTITKFLWDAFHGDLYLSIAYTEINRDGLTGGNYNKTLFSLYKQHDVNKQTKFIELDDQFKNMFKPQPLKKYECTICHRETDNAPDADGTIRCDICKFMEDLGANLRNAEIVYRLIIEPRKGSINWKTGNIINFNNFGVLYVISRKMKGVTASLSDILAILEKELQEKVEAMYGTVMVINKNYFADNTLIEDIKTYGLAISELYMAVHAPTIVNNSFETIMNAEDIAKNAVGDKKIATLKIDVDSLGSIIHTGFSNDLKNPSRLATFSWLLNLFFKGFVNELAVRKYPQSIYLIYSGGDDLLSVGTWNHIYEFSKKIQDQFTKFVSNNGMTISAGYFIGHPKMPFYQSTKIANIALEEFAKSGEKNKISFYGEKLHFITISWTTLQQVDKLFKLLSRILVSESKTDTRYVSRSLLFKLQQLTDIRKQDAVFGRAREVYMLEWIINRFSKAFPNYKDDLEEVKKLYSELGSYVILPLRLTELATK